MRFYLNLKSPKIQEIKSTNFSADFVRTSTMNVGTDTVISDINVAINVQHSLSADIELKLTSPSGTTITLLNSNTCPAGGDIAVTFDDQDLL